MTTECEFKIQGFYSSGDAINAFVSPLGGCMFIRNPFSANTMTGQERFTPTEHAREGIRLSKADAMAKRQEIKEQTITQLSNELWLGRDGDTVVAKACQSAFKALGSPSDKQDAAKQHLLCYAAFKLDKLIENGSYLASPEVNKPILNNIAMMLGIDRHNAGKSALESAARVLVDKAGLDRVDHADRDIKSAVRDKLVQKTLHSLTEEMNHVVDAFFEKHGVQDADGHSISAARIDFKIYDDLQAHHQAMREQNINALHSGLV
ncbi:hypothetical protein [Aeromonas schubertii]|uniref:hypothetical protein n=1 Tax=Aeromonas schubertii TaxID=652 RepID=UPI001CC37652|nr:hypothetical protein [Aeromonas schubertii]